MQISRKDFDYRINFNYTEDGLVKIYADKDKTSNDNIEIILFEEELIKFLLKNKV